MQMIEILASGSAKGMMPRSLIIAPTRELAAQVADNFEKYGKNNRLSMALLIGGVSFSEQEQTLAQPSDSGNAVSARFYSLLRHPGVLLRRT